MKNVSHAVNRMTYGVVPGQLERLSRQGIDAFLAEQLQPARLPEPPELKSRIGNFESLTMDLPTLFFRYSKPPRGAPQVVPNSMEAASPKKISEIRMQAMHAKVLRAVMSPQQLQEVLVDFWYNHFNVYNGKSIATRVWVGAYERDAIRPHIFGKFRDLLIATAKHPAMLTYLDNAQNIAADSPTGRIRGKGLNENYARELLELHTLGVEGGYTQQDVRELARILTGWGLRSPGTGQGLSAFFFNPKSHDSGEKKLLGRLYQAKGADEVEDALTQLASHPSTAQHISFKLAQRFVSDQPPSSLVNKLAKQFTASDGSISQILTVLFQSPEFWDTRNMGNKFKTPLHYLVSCYRSMARTVDNPGQIASIANHWGMPLYGCVTPDGYPCVERTWLNPAAMMDRINFAMNFSHASSVNVIQALTPAETITRLKSTLGPLLKDKTVTVVNAAPEKLRLAMILASPEFMRY